MAGFYANWREKKVSGATKDPVQDGGWIHACVFTLKRTHSWRLGEKGSEKVQYCIAIRKGIGYHSPKVRRAYVNSITDVLV